MEGSIGIFQIQLLGAELVIAQSYCTALLHLKEGTAKMKKTGH